ncbi:MAG: N-6 DNA methylase [Candidatus Dormibacteria bacterium]
MPPFDLTRSLREVASRNPGRTEADIQATIRDILIFGGFDLRDEAVRLESPAENRRRLDVAVGALIIECKRDIRSAGQLSDAEDQLDQYLEAKAGNYVGVLTDGVIWRLYRHVDGILSFVDDLVLVPTRIEERIFRWWLGAILATEERVTPTAPAIEQRLGARSPSFLLLSAELRDCWRAVSTYPAVRLKRELWAKLLRSALGSQFENTDDLFIEHTYLVLLANLISHAVLGFDLNAARNSPKTLLSGRLFEQAGLLGVGQAGFFDWVLESPTGGDVVVGVARRVTSFDWTAVDHDVFKALYQSVIAPEVRHRLGEYYTPDWLAERVVQETVHDPLHQRVMDPACGSGTFVFHAVRRYLNSASADQIPLPLALAGVTEAVFGVDLHPVAVALAQATYLLAIGPQRLAARDRTLSVPVYLGDSMRWEAVDESVFSPAGDVVLRTTDERDLFGSELRFPAAAVADVGRFDDLVSELTTRAGDREPGQPRRRIAGILTRLQVPDDDRKVVQATYEVLCDLYDQGRNHIWGFYVRNQSRPTWLARPENRADVLVGNPPWLAFRFMSEPLQVIFQRRARERQLWAGGGRGRTTQQDLSAFFVVRSIELYLKVGGRFGFVMPRAVLSRQTYGGFRAGAYPSSTELCWASFGRAWDLDQVEPHPFPVPAAVVFGARSTAPKPLAAEVLAWSGRAPAHGTDGGSLVSAKGRVIAVDGDEAGSSYKKRFRNGAILAPRMLVMVEEPAATVVGVGQLRRAIRSRKTTLDKLPWRDVAPLEGAVESQFVRPVYFGESIAPFRVLGGLEAVLPHDGSQLLGGDDDRLDRYPGLAAWWRAAEAVWLEYRSSEKRTLLDQLDYMHQLTAQFPAHSRRVVYTKAGSTLAAATVSDPRVVIDCSLYWASVESVEEARYLTAVLNSRVLTELVHPYQAVGAFGPRHFDKYVWQMPIPRFDPNRLEHKHLSDLAAKAEGVAAQVGLARRTRFQAARRAIRIELDKAGIASQLDAAVTKLIAERHDE